MAVVIDRTSTLERGAEKKRSAGQSDRRCSTTQRLRLARSRSNRIFCASHDRCTFCWIFFGPWLLCRWFVWIPLLRISPATPEPTIGCNIWNWSVSFRPLFSVLWSLDIFRRWHRGRALCRPSFSPTDCLHSPTQTLLCLHQAILVSFFYYVVIQQHMPTSSRSFGLGGDPARESQLLESCHSIPALRTASEHS